MKPLQLKASEPVPLALQVSPLPSVSRAMALDMAAAKAYKQTVDAEVAECENKSCMLKGKVHQKDRSDLGKQVRALKGEEKYIDAVRVDKGLQPEHGFFLTWQQVNSLPLWVFLN